MPNPYIPTNLRIEKFLNDRAIIEWDFPDPAQVRSYVFKVYASLTNSPPFSGPAIATDVPRTEAEIQSISGTANFYVTVSSLNINTNEESAQSSSLFVSMDHTADGVGGAVAKSPSGIPKFFRTDETGQMAVAILPGSGIATEIKQDEQIDLLESINAALGGVQDPFFVFFEDASVPSGVPTLIGSLAVPGSPSILSYYLTGLYITGQGPCLIELNIGVTKKWVGRIGDVNPDINPTFPGSGLKAIPGQHFLVTLTHDHPSPLKFSGNLFGYIR